MSRRPIDIDDERPVAHEGNHDLLRFVDRIHVPVHEASRDMEEAVGLNVGMLSVSAEVEAQFAADDVAEGVTVAVVVPARNRASVDARPDDDRAIRREGKLAQNPGRRVGR